MKGATSYAAFAGIAMVVLLLALAMSYVEGRASPQTKRAALGAPITDKQALARRRAAMNTPAIAGTTAQ